ncbi:MAG: hypothetical protein HeimC2_39490 [Candidatus Heimdallarchaeota archaeon LC_2]|nr:MAG: hypothetical protein HeimC2_39490 [Candidatus Heimdallarchaeota archaeon LC_2]
MPQSSVGLFNMTILDTSQEISQDNAVSVHVAGIYMRSGFEFYSKLIPRNVSIEMDLFAPILFTDWNYYTEEFMDSIPNFNDRLNRYDEYTIIHAISKSEFIISITAIKTTGEGIYSSEHLYDFNIRYDLEIGILNSYLYRVGSRAIDAPGHFSGDWVWVHRINSTASEIDSDADIIYSLKTITKNSDNIVISIFRSIFNSKIFYGSLLVLLIYILKLAYSKRNSIKAWLLEPI